MKGAIFISSVVAIPIVGQFSTPTNDLAVGSAQLVLAIIVVAEAWAILKMYQTWRQDVKDQRLKAEADQIIMQQLVAENTSASALNAESSKQFKEAIYHFSNVIDKCTK